MEKTECKAQCQNCTFCLKGNNLSRNSYSYCVLKTGDAMVSKSDECSKMDVYGKPMFTETIKSMEERKARTA